MNLDFNKATDFAVANLKGVITNAQFSFSDTWQLTVMQEPMRKEQGVELANMPGESFLLVKTSKGVGESIDNSDFFYYVDAGAGLTVMSVGVHLDLTPDSGKPKTKYVFDKVEENGGMFATQKKADILGFIKENYEALTAVGSGTKGMTLNRVTLVQPRVYDKELMYTEDILQSSLRFWSPNEDKLTKLIPISSIINIGDVKSRVTGDLDKAIAEFKRTIPLELGGKLKNDVLRHVDPKDLAEFKKLFETGYNAVVAELESKALFDEERVSSELGTSLNGVVKSILWQINQRIFDPSTTNWNALVSTIMYLMDPANPDFSQYTTLPHFLGKSIEFYVTYVSDELKQRYNKLMENQINIWAYQGNTAVEEALQGKYWKDKDLLYTEKLRKMINAVIEFDLNLCMSHGLVWPMIEPSIKAYATETMTSYYISWQEENKGLLTGGFDLELFVYLTRFKNTTPLYNTQFSTVIKAVYDKDARLLI
jgi:hypothetical protein